LFGRGLESPAQRRRVTPGGDLPLHAGREGLDGDGDGGGSGGETDPTAHGYVLLERDVQKRTAVVFGRKAADLSAVK
jgi:hypothetical protein